MSSRRMFRVNELVKREVSEIVRSELNTETSGLITVTAAEVTNDLRSAYIYYSIIGSPEQQQNVGALFDRYRHSIQRHMARRIRMKRTPVLTFLPDDSIERGNRILQILDQIEADAANKTEAEPAPEQPIASTVDAPPEVTPRPRKRVKKPIAATKRTTKRATKKKG